MNTKIEELSLEDKVKAVNEWQGLDGCFSVRHAIKCDNRDHFSVLVPLEDDGSLYLSCIKCGKLHDVPMRVYEDYVGSRGSYISLDDDGIKTRYDSLEELLHIGKYSNATMLEKVVKFIRRPFYRIWYKACIFGNSVKYSIQKISKGYSDEELWNVGHSIMSYSRPLLKAYFDLEKMGYHTESLEEWEEILSKIERAFYLADMDENSVLRYDTKEELIGYTEEMNEGFTLFGKYLLYLWD